MTLKVEYKEPELIPLPIMRALVEIYYDFQKQRIATFNNVLMNCERNGITEKDLEEKYQVTPLINEAKKFELLIKKRLDSEVQKYKIYDQYLKNIQGIGSIISAGLIANIGDISRFNTISKLWVYAGLGFNKYCPECDAPTYVDVEYEDREGKVKKTRRLKPFENCNHCKEKLDKLIDQEKKLEKKSKTSKKIGGEYEKIKKERLRMEKIYDDGTLPIIQRRTKGYQGNWNARLKVLCWKIGESFVKQKAEKSGYRRMYEKFRETDTGFHPEKEKVDGKTKYNDGHMYNRAIRKTSKLFLSHLWMTWREMEGLEVREPYVVKVLGHDIIKPFIDKK